MAVKPPLSMRVRRAFGPRRDTVGQLSVFATGERRDVWFSFMDEKTSQTFTLVLTRDQRNELITHLQELSFEDVY